MCVSLNENVATVSAERWSPLVVSSSAVVVVVVVVVVDVVVVVAVVAVVAGGGRNGCVSVARYRVPTS